MQSIYRVVFPVALSLFTYTATEAQTTITGTPRPAASANGVATAKPTMTKQAVGKPAVVKPDMAKPSTDKSKPTYLQDVCSLATNGCVRVNPNTETHRTGSLNSKAPTISLLDGGACTALATSKPTPNLAPAVSPATIKTQLGTLQSHVFSIQTSASEIYIYSNDPKLSASEWEGLSAIEQQIALLARTPGFTIERRLPRANTLGNFTASIKGYLPPGLTVVQSGMDSYLLTSDGTVSCAAIQAFLTDIDRFASHPQAETPLASILSLDPASVGNVLGATAIPYAAAGTAALTPLMANTAATSSASSPAAASSVAAGASATGGSSGAASSSGAPASSSSPLITIATTMPVISNAATTPIQTVPTPALGASASIPPTPTSPASPTLTTTISTAAAATPPATPVTPAAPTVTPATPFSVNGRDLYFNETTPGDDAAITERKRALALLDLPQPQVLINAWVIQSSTSNPKEAGKVTNLLQETVNDYNNIIQKSLYQGWLKLRSEVANEDYFDKAFHDYISLRTVYEPKPVVASVSAPVATTAFSESLRESEGICKLDEYCLGYSTALDPVEPRLTDMLIALLAAKDPVKQANAAINAVESDYPAPNRGRCPLALSSDMTKTVDLSEVKDINICSDEDSAEPKDPTSKRIWGELMLKNPTDKTAPVHYDSCQIRDERYLIRNSNHLMLECFREVLGSMAIYPDKNNGISQLGLVRASIADFLFNYKRSQQYPHEFSPYDLSTSAQELDAQLALFIHAFNEDLQAYQTFIRARFIVQSQDEKVSGDKNTFLNDGIITLQTTSGDVATVATGTTSYMNVSRAPTVSQLLNSIVGTTPAGSSGTALSGVLSNLSFNQAQVLMGALAAYQTTSLNVNRQLNLIVKPRSLLGASAAEIDVQLNADQGPNTASYWSPGPSGTSSGAADLSQITQHDITTHVRIDSIRLFEISSLTAVLSKGRDKFPLLPPFVEIPYIGTLFGIPLHAAKEFHSSSAVLSAVIVPTATDIAYGLRFYQDRVISNPSGIPVTDPYKIPAPKAQSFSDFGNHSVIEYHRKKVRCIAKLTGALATTAQPSVDACALSLQNVLQDGIE